MSGSRFSDFLQRELVNRIRANPGYSLRAFARDLQLSPSSLSRMLRNQRNLSDEMMARLGARVGLSPEQLRKLSKHPAADASELSGKAIPKGEVLSAEDFHQLREEEFRVISDWYHYAILELVTIKGFQANAKWIAGALGISAVEARIAVERLLKLGLLKKTSTGKLLPSAANNSNLDGDLRGAAFRSLQRQALEGAIRALERFPLEERDQSTMTMAIAEKDFPLAVELLTEFRRAFCARLQRPTRPRERVYQLSLSFYPLSRTPSSDSSSERKKK